VILNNNYVQEVAGSFSGDPGFVDDQGPFSSFRFPRGVALGKGDWYAFVADTGNHAIRRIIISTGDVTTLVGQKGSPQAGYREGIGNVAQFNSPHDVSCSLVQGNFILVADTMNRRIRFVTLSNKKVETKVGGYQESGGVTPPGNKDGVGLQASFNLPVAIALAPDDSFAVVSDIGNNNIRYINLATNGTTTLVGFNQYCSTPWGRYYSLTQAYGVTVSHDKTFVLITDAGDHTVKHLDISSGVLKPVAGNGNNNTFRDDVGNSATFNQPHGIAILANGKALIADTNHHRFRALVSFSLAPTKSPSTSPTAPTAPTNLPTVSPSKAPTREIINTKTPTGSPTVPTVAPTTNSPTTVSPTKSPTTLAPTIPTAKPTSSWKQVATVAGSGVAGRDDGLPLVATFNKPCGIAVDNTGEYAVVTDLGTHSIRKIALINGLVSTLAGSMVSAAGFVDDKGPFAAFNSPRGVAFAKYNWYVFIADTGNHVIRRIIMGDGRVTTIIGNAGTPGYKDLIGIKAEFNQPYDVAGCNICAEAEFGFVADYGNRRVRRVDFAAKGVTTVAGSGMAGSTNGVGRNAAFNQIVGIAIAPDDSFAVVSDAGDGHIRFINLTKNYGNNFDPYLFDVTTLCCGSYSSTVWGFYYNFTSVSGVTVLPDKDILVVDNGANVIRHLVVSNGTDKHIAGNTSVNGFFDGVGGNATFKNAQGIFAPKNGKPIITDTDNNRIRSLYTFSLSPTKAPTHAPTSPTAPTSAPTTKKPTTSAPTSPTTTGSPTTPTSSPTTAAEWAQYLKQQSEESGSDDSSTMTGVAAGTGALLLIVAVSVGMYIKKRRKAKAAGFKVHEINFADLKITKFLGKGAFGNVNMAIYNGTNVAVKELQVITEESMEDFNLEIQINQLLPPHPNVVKMLGIAVGAKKGLVMELYKLRAIEDFMEDEPDKWREVSFRDKLQMAIDGSAGLCLMHSHRVIHRDVACRNILLHEDFRGAVADFGLSMQMGKDLEEDVSPKENERIPVFASAPEALTDAKFSPKTDVYMFGIFLWELFAGCPPYSGTALVNDCTHKKNMAPFKAAVCSGKFRPEIPEDWPKELAALMKKCWSNDSRARPDMESVNFELRQIQELAIEQNWTTPSTMDDIEKAEGMNMYGGFDDEDSGADDDFSAYITVGTEPPEEANLEEVKPDFDEVTKLLESENPQDRAQGCALRLGHLSDTITDFSEKFKDTHTLLGESSEHLQDKATTLSVESLSLDNKMLSLADTQQNEFTNLNSRLPQEVVDVADNVSRNSYSGNYQLKFQARSKQQDKKLPGLPSANRSDIPVLPEVNEQFQSSKPVLVARRSTSKASSATPERTISPSPVEFAPVFPGAPPPLPPVAVPPVPPHVD